MWELPSYVRPNAPVRLTLERKEEAQILGRLRFHEDKTGPDVDGAAVLRNPTLAAECQLQPLSGGSLECCLESESEAASYVRRKESCSQLATSAMGEA